SSALLPCPRIQAAGAKEGRRAVWRILQVNSITVILIGMNLSQISIQYYTTLFGWKPSNPF
ncbi:MAG TPA: hypothetical protein O0X95_06095, partial [Methanocorpusculum sp.]|nr:hypothetical protein [Methanocorpusculum sp.]